MFDDFLGRPLAGASNMLEPPSWREAGGSRRTSWSPRLEGARGSGVDGSPYRKKRVSVYCE